MVAGANKQYYVQPYISVKKQRENRYIFTTKTGGANKALPLLHRRFSMNFFLPNRTKCDVAVAAQGDDKCCFGSRSIGFN